jgi:ParB-like nuclease domain
VTSPLKDHPHCGSNHLRPPTSKDRSRLLLTDAPMSTGLVALAERIELWPIDRLRPYERNPRTHSEAQVDQIAASMVEFGWTNPILIDENAGILAGHGRMLAARKLGLAEVPVMRFEHLTGAQNGPT